MSLAWKVLAMGVLLAWGPSAEASEPRFALGGAAGWTFTNARVYHHTERASNAFAWDASLGYRVTPRLEIGLLWDRQTSTVEDIFSAYSPRATLRQEGGHAYVAYDLRRSGASLRPYLLAGLGASRRTLFHGRHRDPPEARASLTVGSGLKVHLARRWALHLGSRWTMTVVDAQADETICYNRGPCVEYPGYSSLSSRLEVSGGIVFGL